MYVEDISQPNFDLVLPFTITRFAIPTRQNEGFMRAWQQNFGHQFGQTKQ